MKRLSIVLLAACLAAPAGAQTVVPGGGSGGASSVNGDTGAVIVAAKRGVTGLTGSRNSGTATRLDIAADQVLFVNPSTSKIAIASPVTSQAIDIATAGPAAGGRDQAGAFSSGGTVNFFFIQKDDGTIGGIASTAAATTGPTLPSGYTRWSYATTMVMTTSNLPLAIVRGSTVTYQTVQTLLSVGTATVETAVTTALSTVVPANALTFQALLYLDNASASTGTFVANYRVLTGVNQVTVSLGVAVATGSAATSMTAVLPNVSQTLLYINGSALTRSTASIIGYTVPNGDT